MSFHCYTNGGYMKLKSTATRHDRLHRSFTCLLLVPLIFLAACSSGIERTPLEVTASEGYLKATVRSTSDDAEEFPSGVMVTGSGANNLDFSDAGKKVGLRFTGLDIPKGATVTKAYLSFKVASSSSGYTKLTVRAEDSDMARSFSSSKRNISSRRTTSAAASWRPSSWRKGAVMRSADLSNVVQEVISRSYWNRGDALALIVSGDNKARRSALSRNSGGTRYAPSLRIWYREDAGPQIRAGRGVPVILDTDLGIDVDDAGALAVLHALADKGEANILATVSNVNDPYAPGALDAINTYYGRPNIPVGRNSKQQYSIATPYWRKHDPRFVRDLATKFPNDTSTRNLKTAVSVYRRALADQPDGSVTVISIGFMQNLADLMASGSDSYSSLSGMELIKRKVKRLVVMGGTYPRSDRDLYLKGGKDISPSPAIRVIDGWPTTIVFTAGNVCGGISTGQTLARRTPRANPVRAAYTLFFNKEGVGRDSWDLCSVLYAVRGVSHSGDGTYFAESKTNRHLTLNMSGHSEWRTPSASRHKRLVRVMSASTIAAKLEALIVKAPEN